ncbi:MAG TPA: hypothetical protein PLK10_13475 [Ottowia sp.]|nr:hypothetical protein [Ottowia sp.]
MKYTLIILSAVGVLAGAFAAWAQSEAADPPASPPVADKAVERGAARSPLWMTVEAQYRQRGAEPGGDDRRLTPDQRLELREQIRRGIAPGPSSGERGAGVQTTAR